MGANINAITEEHVQGSSGSSSKSLSKQQKSLLDSDYDPATYDAEMAQYLGEDYYEEMHTRTLPDDSEYGGHLRRKFQRDPKRKKLKVRGFA